MVEQLILVILAIFLPPLAVFLHQNAVNQNVLINLILTIFFWLPDSLSSIGTPGILIPLTQNTRAVLSSEHWNNIIIVATQFGQGRCLVFGHNGYPSIFLDSETEDTTFVENCRKWLAQEKSDVNFFSIDDVQSMGEVSQDSHILVWDGHRTKTNHFMNDLCKHLQDGGALICGATPCGWLERNKGKTLADFPFTRFCDYIGVKLTDNSIECPDSIPFQSELVAFKNISHVAEELANDPDNNEHLNVISWAIKELGDALPDLPVETLRNIIMNTGDDIIPLADSPIRDKSCREHSTSICRILYALPGIKAPGITNFPGDFDDSPPVKTNVTCHIESNYSEWFCTGYYVAAGIPVEIEVLEKVGESTWYARVGCHSDDLDSCREFRRWPCISVRKPLIGNRIRLNSPFGGLLFLESPENESNAITIRLHHVVLTPTYDLTDPDREIKWNNLHSHAQGLWADIAGQYIVFNMPSKFILNFNSAQLDRVLQFWDNVILAQHELRSTNPTNRERIVCDEQPSFGYMHSGYPIVTHMDVFDPNNDGFILHINQLEKNGAWGLFHEIGHNMQRDSWTFDGTDEVTVNIFTLYTMDTLCHVHVWIHPWLKEQMPDALKYIKNGSDFDQWKQTPEVALFIYAQLAREFGWDSYKAVFRQYEEDEPDLGSDQEKIDHWVTIFSRQVEYNLIPLFKFWGFPISQSTVDALDDLEIPEISDEFIKLAPERYQI